MLNRIKKTSIRWVVIFCLFSIVSGCVNSNEIADDDQALIDELYEALTTKLLDVWYPVSIDSVYGGFLSDLTYDWQVEGRQNKMLVTQTRHVWTTSQAAMFLHDDRYREIAAHGYRFLRDVMWDKEYGGFHMLLTREGSETASTNRGIKSAYGNAFAVYALASYYAMSGDQEALALAQKTFHWLDAHSRDPELKGYFDAMAQDGTWLFEAEAGRRGYLARAEWKDQNSSIHLLEAFTALYSVWPDDLLRDRLSELLFLIRDTITTEGGYLTLFLQRDWTPVSFRDSTEAVLKANFRNDHVSFGHDVETAFLMLEASHVLGIENDTDTPTVAKRMVDHALDNGWDTELGGFFEGGYYFKGVDTCAVVDKRKTWWVQAEGLNALLLMAKLFPRQERYHRAFLKQWQYLNSYLIDHQYGGWYRGGLDQDPGARTAPKGSDWKINYHNLRGLMNCIKMLTGDDPLVSLTSH